MKIKTITLSVVIMIAFCACNEERKHRWPSFQGNKKNTGFKDVNGPKNLDKLIWKFEAEGEITSSPAVSNGLVVFGSADNHLYALEAKTGQEKWKFEAQRYIVSSPAISKDLVFLEPIFIIFTQWM
jgi:hypothetical protein